MKGKINIEEIKRAYTSLDKKGDFIQKLAFKFEMKPMSIHNHWFGQFLAIPESKQNEVYKMLQKEIKIQNQLKKESA